MALCYLGALHLRGGDLLAARGHFAHAVSLYRELGDSLENANALRGLGLVAVLEERDDQAGTGDVPWSLRRSPGWVLSLEGLSCVG